MHHWIRDVRDVESACENLCALLGEEFECRCYTRDYGGGIREFVLDFTDKRLERRIEECLRAEGVKEEDLKPMAHFNSSGSIEYLIGEGVYVEGEIPLFVDERTRNFVLNLENPYCRVTAIHKHGRGKCCAFHVHFKCKLDRTANVSYVERFVENLLRSVKRINRH